MWCTSGNILAATVLEQGKWAIAICDPNATHCRDPPMSQKASCCPTLASHNTWLDSCIGVDELQVVEPERVTSQLVPTGMV